MPTVGREEVKALQEVLTSGRITTGEEVACFEQEMAAYLGLTGGGPPRERPTEASPQRESWVRRLWSGRRAEGEAGA